MSKSAREVSTDTIGNLLSAYNSERNAAARYITFAVEADKEGYGGVASMFRAVSHSEQIHATSHARVLHKLDVELELRVEHTEVRRTRENLLLAIKGEEDECEQMYPAYKAEAAEDGCRDAVQAFEQAGEVEVVHALMFRAALDSLDDYRERTMYYVCSGCGWVCGGMNFKRCIICHNPKERFDKID